MSDDEKVLTYEEAKQMCMKAFDGGALYGSESMRYGVNATAYDWDHWLKKNGSLFKPTDSWERIIEDAIRGDGGSYGCLEERFNAMVPSLVARCKALVGDAS